MIRERTDIASRIAAWDGSLLYWTSIYETPYNGPERKFFVPPGQAEMLVAVVRHGSGYDGVLLLFDSGRLEVIVCRKSWLCRRLTWRFENRPHMYASWPGMKFVDTDWSLPNTFTMPCFTNGENIMYTGFRNFTTCALMMG
jgi:hypothetical protein